MIENTVTIELDQPNHEKYKNVQTGADDDNDYSDRWWSDIGAPTFHFITPSPSFKTYTYPSRNPKTTKSPLLQTSSGTFNFYNQKTTTSSTTIPPTTTSAMAKAILTTIATTEINKLISFFIVLQSTTFPPPITAPFFFSNTPATPSTTIYAVRPTTPMGTMNQAAVGKGLATNTGTDFPRTAFISIGAISVIFIIVVVMFCVFRCRQAAPVLAHYPMYMNNNHKGPPLNNNNQGYAPVPTDMSPQLMGPPHHCENTKNGHLMYGNGDGVINGMFPPESTLLRTQQPNFCPNAATPTTYQSTTLPAKQNGRLEHSMLYNGHNIHHHNTNTLGSRNTPEVTIIKAPPGTQEPKKRGFKEWYV
uniref:Uncharacterized protein n=1 Tax=Rhabditophanes sp. KR3021 TaxID=114890 RepID=A0AC35TWE0_9BILA